MKKPTKKTAEPKPTPKNKVSKRARRVAIVERLVKQKTPSQIAKSIGVSRKTVYEELKDPETLALIEQWMKPYHQEIRELIPDAIAAVRDGLMPINLSVDRVRAVKALGVMMGWAQGKTENDDEHSPLRRFSGTMEELLIVYRTLTAGESQTQAT